MGDLEEISRHFQNKLCSLRRMLDLSAADLPQHKIQKLAQDILGLRGTLDEFEKCVDRQKEQLNQLREFERLCEKDVEFLQHMKENIPAHIPKRRSPVRENKPAANENTAADVQPTQTEPVRKRSRALSLAREMDYITTQEYNGIPQYMKGRVSYEQLNATVQRVNTALTAKYKILAQPMRALNNHTRKLQQRFKDQETKDTKGKFFIVEDDICEFTQMKVDKRFQGILNMLRHFQRLREIRGGGCVRYVLV